MSSFALLQPFLESVVIVDFSSGTLPPICVSLTKSPVIFQGRVYRPEPSLKIDLPKQGGGLNEEPAKVVIPTNRPEVHSALAQFATTISSLRAFPRTIVRVIEILRTSTSDSRTLYLYEGIITKVQRNPSGRTNVMELDVETELHEGLTDVSLGRRCDPQCDVIFGSNGCGVDNRKFFDTLTYYPNHVKKTRKASVVVSFSGSDPRMVLLTLDPVVHPGADNRTITEQPEGWWEASYLERGGLRMRVQSWVFRPYVGAGTNKFVLNQIPPPDWDGAVAALVLDCPRTPQACADRNNTINFGGLGHGIPAYNPTLETKGG